MVFYPRDRSRLFLYPGPTGVVDLCAPLVQRNLHNSQQHSTWPVDKLGCLLLAMPVDFPHDSHGPCL